MSSKFLFVVGCPRSGTTALGSLLAQHPDIALGIERYGHRAFRENFSLDPSLFLYERFFDFRSGDTFYNTLDFAPIAYKDIKDKFHKARYRGDKIPLLYKSIDKLMDAFDGNIKVIFIFRNIFDVAASYKVRLLRDDDDWNKGVSEAINDWTQAIDSYKRNQELDVVFPVVYEDLIRSEETFSSLLNFLGLTACHQARVAYRNLQSRSETLEGQRNRELTTGEVFEICNRAPFGGYREIVQRARELGKRHA